ncbi:putative WD repeat-containing protein [Neolecta irregularis DAH-3]|uniref:Putative WD repeat-containing protein n=1 Tax=Neolecta irregularis (strain DAH-3) TaxID=1198029 RepID=A0A1U7LM66_NEOID|nr:putative WD repeat-containing protein [Neolecta irregularis DAH-3]|eukprot:OLL23760.1 putative WD repeat-containing protein [Neolecta irregularis DAH-3]
MNLECLTSMEADNAPFRLFPSLDLFSESLTSNEEITNTSIEGGNEWDSNSSPYSDNGSVDEEDEGSGDGAEDDSEVGGLSDDYEEFSDAIGSWEENFATHLFSRDRTSFPSLFASRALDFVHHVEAANGQNVQGLNLTEREIVNLRSQRDLQYLKEGPRNDLNFPHLKTLKPPGRTKSLYKFQQTSNKVRTSIPHFQLRNLIHPISLSEVYYACSKHVGQWNAVAQTTQEFMKFPTSMASFLRAVEATSLAAHKEVVVLGGFLGEYGLRKIGSDDLPIQGLITDNATSGITNHINIWETRSGILEAVFANNDNYVRTMDLRSLQFLKTFPKFEFPVNCTAMSPDRRLRAIVGDNMNTFITDASNSQLLTCLEGHKDFSFACEWSEDWLFATGNQDCTARIYDARNWSSPLLVFPTRYGAVRSLRFHGSELAISEPADLVHVLDTRDLSQCQTLEFFGEISGIGFVEDSLFIANAEPRISGLLEWRRTNSSEEGLWELTN